VLTLTLNRPDKRNAIDSPMVEQLLQQLERAGLDADVSVVVLRGAGKDFCAGADLAEMLASADRSAGENEASARRLGEVFIAMRRLPKAVVAVVHGRALAGGCGLATACDLVLAQSDASFGYPEVRRGFVPAMVMAMLRRAVGEKVAFDLVGTGRLLTAEEARALGLVARVFPAASFDEDVAQLLGELAASSASALAFIKRQLYEIDGRSFEEAIDLGAKVNATARATPDFAQAVSRFLKR
jgi:methylglutaconyl-CoA hydratase